MKEIKIKKTIVKIGIKNSGFTEDIVNYNKRS